MTTKKMIRYQMTAPGAPLDPVESPLPEPGAGEVLIEIAGCGVCHTDVGFYSGAVKTKQPLPMTLGHEISGRVVKAGPGDDSAARLMGQAVIVPAVIPCGACDACAEGRGSICPSQIFLGNDIHGGFATHVL
ncbi:MAG TPA: alcohol dehydrogenase catalytic domain-containing protein, partial [Candidatus Saccharimonadales bacterium]|nr:alcohol dehydrogenase catalytic domain-containing protein [Candidatus Saccharimonadales bacterium]